MPSRLEPDDNDGLEELLRGVFLSGLTGSEMELELGSSDSRARVLLEGRERIDGSEILASAFEVLSNAAAAKAKKPLDAREFNLETDAVWR